MAALVSAPARRRVRMPQRIQALNRRRLFTPRGPAGACAAEWWALGAAVAVLLLVAGVAA